MEATTATTTIRATPAAVMAVIADLPAYPEWSDGVVSAEVLEEDAQGRPRTARMKMLVGPVNEVFELHYEWGEDTVEWELTSGGLLSQLRGRYQCVGTDDGSTEVTYDLRLELALPMIGTVRQRGERQILNSALRGLRRRVEAAPAG